MHGLACCGSAWQLQASCLSCCVYCGIHLREACCRRLQWLQPCHETSSLRALRLGLMPCRLSSATTSACTLQALIVDGHPSRNIVTQAVTSPVAP